MDDVFDKFLRSVETSSRNAELKKLLEEKAIPNDEIEKTKAELALLNKEIAANSAENSKLVGPETTKALFFRAQMCVRDARQCGKRYNEKISSINTYAPKLNVERKSLDDIVERSKTIGERKFTKETNMKMVHTFIAQSQHLYADIKRRSEMAASSFNMTNLVMTVNKISDRQKVKKDLVIERDAQWKFVEEYEHDLEVLRAKSESEHSSVQKMEAELVKVDALLDQLKPVHERLSTAVATTTESITILRQQLATWESKQLENQVHNTTMQNRLNAASSRRSKAYSMIEEQKLSHHDRSSKKMNEIKLLEESANNNKMTKGGDVSATMKHKEDAAEELRQIQQQIENISKIKKRFADGNAEKDVFENELSEIQIQNAAIIAELEKMDADLIEKQKESEQYTAALKMEVGELESEVILKESKLEENMSLKNSTQELKRTRDDLSKQVGLLMAQAASAEAAYRREQVQAMRDSTVRESKKENGRKVCKQSNSTKVSKKSNSRDRASKSSTQRTKEDQPANVLKKKKRDYFSQMDTGPAGDSLMQVASQPPSARPYKEHPAPKVTEHISGPSDDLVDDSLYAGSDDDGEDDDDDFNFTFSSLGPKGAVPAHPPPALFADSPALLSRSSTILFEPDTCVTSTPISIKRDAAGRDSASMANTKRRGTDEQPARRGARTKRGGRK